MSEGIARDGVSGALAADCKPVNPIASMAPRFELKTARISRSALIASLVLSFVAITADPAVAQSLANLPGQTELQIRTGTAITTVCVALIGLRTDRTGPSDTEDLFARCGDMVQTANDILGAGATTFSLGLTAAQTNEALVEIAHDEAAAFGANSTEIRSSQAKSIAGRLSAIRRGATGFSLAGLHFDVPGEARRRVSLADMMGSVDSAGEAAGSSGESWFAGRLGAFLSGSLGTGDADGSSEEAGYDVTLFSISAGLDYRITDSFVAGAAIWLRQ